MYDTQEEYNHSGHEPEIGTVIRAIPMVALSNVEINDADIR